MAVRLQILRDVFANVAPFVAKASELMWATDTKALYVGDGSTAGGMSVAMAPVSVSNGGTGNTNGRGAASALSLLYVPDHITNNVSITGTTSEAIAGYINVPANAVGANGSVELDFVIDGSGATNANFVVVLRAAAGSGGTTSTSATAIINNTGTKGDTLRVNLLIFNTGTTNSQKAFQAFISSFTQTSNALKATSVDTTQAWTISVNLQPGNSADIIVLDHLHAKLIATAGN